MANNKLIFIIFVVGLVGVDLPMKADVLTAAPFAFSTTHKIITMKTQTIWKDIEVYESIYKI